MPRSSPPSARERFAAPARPGKAFQGASLAPPCAGLLAWQKTGALRGSKKRKIWLGGRRPSFLSAGPAPSLPDRRVATIQRFGVHWLAHHVHWLAHRCPLAGAICIQPAIQSSDHPLGAPAPASASRSPSAPSGAPSPSPEVSCTSRSPWQAPAQEAPHSGSRRD